MTSRDTIVNEKGQTLVVITRKDDTLEGMLGWAEPKRPGWMTTTVYCGMVGVQLRDEDYRLPSIGTDRVLIPYASF